MLILHISDNVKQLPADCWTGQHLHVHDCDCLGRTCYGWLHGSRPGRLAAELVRIVQFVEANDLFRGERPPVAYYFFPTCTNVVSLSHVDDLNRSCVGQAGRVG